MNIPASLNRRAVVLLILVCAFPVAALGCSQEEATTRPVSVGQVELRELPALSIDESRAAISDFEQNASAPWAAARVTIPGECGGLGYSSLRDAVANADAIVVGRVTTVEFIFDGETRELARLAVEEVIRGNPDQLYVLNITGGPRILDGELALTQHPTNPLLVPGDRGLFLLQRMSLTAAFVPQGYSGQFRFDESGRVQTVLGNPFADGLADLNAKSLEKSIRKLATQ